MICKWCFEEETLDDKSICENCLNSSHEEDNFEFEGLIKFKMTYGLKMKFEDIIEISKEQNCSLIKAIHIHNKEQNILREKYIKRKI